jgi:hypothetical protein
MEIISEISLYNITTWLQLKHIYKLVTIPVFSEYILKFIQCNHYWQKMIDNIYRKMDNQILMN